MIPDDLLNLFGIASVANNSLPDILNITVLVPFGIFLAAPLLVLCDVAREYVVGPT